MSNHVATITKNEGRCSFSRKALSVFMAVLLAFLMMPMIPAEKALAASGSVQDAWNLAKIEYSVEADGYGRYVTDQSTQMVVDSIEDVDGNVLGTGDFEVLYFADTNTSTGNAGVLDSSDRLVGVGNSVPSANGGIGTYPKDAGNYFIAIFQGEAPHADRGEWAYTTWGDYSSAVVRTQLFRIDASSENPLEGAFAYEVKTDHDDFSDVTFKFDGGNHSIAFSANGKKLVDAMQDDSSALDSDSEDYIVRWTEYAGAQAPVWDKNTASYVGYTLQAGDYAATIYDNEGHQAIVEFTIEPIDLSSDSIVLPTIDDQGDGYTGAVKQVVVNGQAVSTASNSQISRYLNVVATNYEDVAGADHPYPTTLNGKGIYTFQVSAANVEGGNNNIVGGPVEVTGCIVDNVVNFTYNGKSLGNGDGEAFEDAFVVSTGVVFNPALLSAKADETDVDFTWSVTKDGQPVSSYTEPGEYVLTVDSKVTDGFKSAGHETATFTVVAKPAANYTYFASIDGKAVNGDFYYNGKAYVPTITVVDKDGVKAVEGTDYTVRYELDGEEIESMVDADAYDVVIDYADNRLTDDSFRFTIQQAEIVEVYADQPFYAYTGEAIQPTFTGYTKENKGGVSVTLVPGTDVVKYSVLTDDSPETYKSVSASDLVEVGTYKADVAVSAANKNFKGSKSASFKIAETVAYADVAADAWYADEIALASQTTPVKYGYMTGIPGTNLFMPEASITRAQTAQVLFNMAGGVSETGYYPTAFSDVNGWAWYAQPIAWASQASIVTGIGDTGAFAPDENVTREQAATMLYRYVKAQGKDVSATADLSAYADGASVSDWASEAMQWAVANDVFGVNTDTLRPQEDLSRAEMAAIAVRVQPDGAYEKLS